jgi:hypothetical protein
MKLCQRLVASLILQILFASVLWGQTPPVELRLDSSAPFRFASYGDTRFTDPSNAEPSNAPVRNALVQGIADAPK